MAVGMGRRLSRNVNDNLDSIAGGAVGIGAPVALRETADVMGGETVSLLGAPGSTLARATRPSVAWGIGVGGLTGLLWWADAGGRALQDFYLAHTVTGVPTGIASALLPRSPGDGGASEQAQRFVDSLRRTGSNGSSGGGGRNDFAPAGGTSPDTQPAQ